MLVRLAHLVHRRRGRFVALWAVLTAFGVFATMQVSSRWFESFSIPGYSAYETNQKTVKTFGTGEQAPLVAVFHSKGDVTKHDLTPAIEKAAAVNPGSRVSSYFDSHNVLYVSRDRHTTFAEIYPPGQNTFSSEPHIGRRAGCAAGERSAGRRGISHRAAAAQRRLERRLRAAARAS